MIIASRAQVKKLKCREEVKNMEYANGHSFLTEVVEGQSWTDQYNAEEDFSIIKNQRLAAEFKHQQQLLALQSLPSIAPTQLLNCHLLSNFCETSFHSCSVAGQGKYSCINTSQMTFVVSCKLMLLLCLIWPSLFTF